QHFHADHPVFSCSKSEQKQLNTWVSFQSAEQPLLGQFSVSGNTLSFYSLELFEVSNENRYFGELNLYWCVRCGFYLRS
ncbi:hypothetical protein, partial [Pseudomonas sp. K2I15]|uniref:hypothetical protein n=1 Tax=Pseudomonas sp. K2I15 TaxID=2013577 RepID=UPI000B4D61F6